MSRYPTRAQILDVLDYHPETGTFTRKSDGAKSGTLVNGYWFDYVQGRQIPRGVLVWIVEHNREPVGRIRYTNDREDTRIGSIGERPFKRRKWTQEDSDNFDKNQDRFRSAFAGSGIDAADWTWKVALLS